MKISNGTAFHFMGIGGAGMSALAQILLEQKYAVSGCDVAASKITERLQKMGGRVTIGHDPRHVLESDVVVYSSAISPKDPELVQALSSGKTVLHRSHMLSFLCEGKKGIAVTGCHGKTTTSSMIAAILIRAGWDPSAVIGAEVKELNGNARHGNGAHIVFEADESDGSFVHFSPETFVVTNLDNDHLDFYQSFPKLLESFKEYVDRRREKQRVFVSGEDPALREWKKDLSSAQCVTFGFGDHNDFAVEGLETAGWRSFFTLLRHGKPAGRIELALPGLHNVMNAVAAAAVTLELGVPFQAVNETLAQFRGAERRFEVKGEARDVLVVDDYAHHPTEISAALEAARRLSRRKVICVFQPHRYTRTRDLSVDFPRALSAADQVLLTDVYSASEAPIAGVDGSLLYTESRRAGYSHFRYVKNLKDIAPMLLPELQGGELVMTVGAGDVYKVGEELVEKLRHG